MEPAAPTESDPAEEEFSDEEMKTAAEHGYDRLVARVGGIEDHQARIAQRMEEIRLHQVTLRKIRQARSLTQATMAEFLDIDQPHVSRLERQTDLMLSTLRRFIEAAGGELHLVVSFPGEEPAELTIGESAA
ncbi:MAG: XRE family transcriptional regulator [Acidimicrobiales bacterium]